MSVQERVAMEESNLPFFNPGPIKYNWDQEIKDIKLRYALSYIPATILMHLVYRNVESHGSWNVPKEGGFILAVNHQSYMDPIDIYYGMKGKRCMYFMSKEEFFHSPPVRAVFDFYHAFPVYRNTSDKESLDFAARVIKEGKVLTLFPQGTRNQDHSKPVDFKPGAALLAREAEADVLPVSLHLEQGKKFRPKLIIRYGELIPYEDLGFTKGSRKSKELSAASKMIEEKVQELWEMDTI